MSEYTVVASRGANAAGEARGRSVAIPLATLRNGQLDALAPVELLLAAIAAGVLGGRRPGARQVRGWGRAAARRRLRPRHLYRRT